MIGHDWWLVWRVMMFTKKSFDSPKNIRAASIGSPTMLANKRLNRNFRIFLSCCSVFFTYSSTRDLIAVSCIFLSCNCYIFYVGILLYFFLVSSIWQHLLQWQPIIQLSEDDLSFYIVSVTPSFCCTSPPKHFQRNALFHPFFVFSSDPEWAHRQYRELFPNPVSIPAALDGFSYWLAFPFESLMLIYTLLRRWLSLIRYWANNVTPTKSQTTWLVPYCFHSLWLVVVVGYCHDFLRSFCRQAVP